MYNNKTKIVEPMIRYVVQATFVDDREDLEPHKVGYSFKDKANAIKRVADIKRNWNLYTYKGCLDTVTFKTIITEDTKLWD
ncbi:MAG: hypothetical protein ACRDBY_14230 [Cetobacterium sp.]